MTIADGLVAPERLTARESQVYLAIASGYGNKDIARALNVSPKTASELCRRILEKFKFHSRYQIVQHAYEPALRCLIGAQWEGLK